MIWSLLMNCDVIGDYNFLVNDWKLLFRRPNEENDKYEVILQKLWNCSQCESIYVILVKITSRLKIEIHRKYFRIKMEWYSSKCINSYHIKVSILYNILIYTILLNRMFIIQFECLENVLLINNIRIILSVQLDIRSYRNLLHNNKIREIFATKSNANILI